MYKQLGKKTIFSQIDKIYIILFFVSWLHSVLGLLFCVSLLYYCKYGAEGGVKGLVLLTTRGLLSTAVSASISMPMMKYVVLFGLSIWIIMRAKLQKNDYKKAQIIIFTGTVFSLFTIFAALFSSSYPVTSAFKVVSFFVPFCAVLLGVGATYNKVDWLNYFFVFYGMLFAISFVLLPFPQFRITNDDFQGVFNHVNLLGILSAVYIAAVLFAPNLKGKGMLTAAIICAVLYMEFSSASRTGMLSALIIIFVWWLCKVSSINIKNKVYVKKRNVLLIYIIVCIIVLLLQNKDFMLSVGQAVEEFLWKNNATTITASRMGAVDNMELKFQNNKWIGSGFMVPYVEGIKDYGLYFGLIVEPGNILLSLLGDVGYIGFTLFAVFLLGILISGKLSRFALIIGALMVCMGEMVFFSSNNMSILLYLLIAVFVFGDGKVYENEHLILKKATNYRNDGGEVFCE